MSKIGIFRFHSQDSFELAKFEAERLVPSSFKEMLDFPSPYFTVLRIVSNSSQSQLENLKSWLETHPLASVLLPTIITDPLGDIEAIKQVLTKEMKTLVSDFDLENIQFPILQIALDLLSLQDAARISKEIPPSDRIFVEAGTPLIKSEGLRSITAIKQARPGSYVVADLKTLDTGALEVKMAAEAGAEIISISGLADDATINAAIEEARKQKRLLYVDMMNVEDPVGRLEKLKIPPPVVLLHRGIDMELAEKEHKWGFISQLKQRFPQVRVAVAGGLNLESTPEALQKGADIIIVGRAITKAPDIKATCEEFIQLLS